MQMRIASVAGALFVALLVGVSLAGASSPYKRYTFPAAPPYAVTSPGSLTVLLPSAWTVKTTWTKTHMPWATNARYPYWRQWGIDADLPPKGTTLADIQARETWSGCRKGLGWGPKVPGGYDKVLASGYMTLPVGRVWHSTMRHYWHKGCWTGARDSIRQTYWLDRNLVSLDGQEVFLSFTGFCGIKQCPAYTRQLAVIMHSIRLLPG